jgi:hypothetical protein
MENAMKILILRILISAILISLISGVVVSLMGLVLTWKTSTQFSDGFFWAGAAMAAIGFISLQGYSQRAINWPPVFLNSDERSGLWGADIFHGKIIMVIFGISGLMLFGMSALVLRLF